MAGGYLGRWFLNSKLQGVWYYTRHMKNKKEESWSKNFPTIMMREIPWSLFLTWGIITHQRAHAVSQNLKKSEILEVATYKLKAKFDVDKG